MRVVRLACLFVCAAARVSGARAMAAGRWGGVRAWASGRRRSGTVGRPRTHGLGRNVRPVCPPERVGRGPAPRSLRLRPQAEGRPRTTNSCLPRCATKNWASACIRRTEGAGRARRRPRLARTADARRTPATACQARLAAPALPAARGPSDGASATVPAGPPAAAQERFRLALQRWQEKQREAFGSEYGCGRCLHRPTGCSACNPRKQ